jgi:hypothetical protein
VPWINRASPSPGWITANWEVARKRRYFPLVHDPPGERKPPVIRLDERFGLCAIDENRLSARFSAVSFPVEFLALIPNALTTATLSALRKFGNRRDRE